MRAACAALGTSGLLAHRFWSELGRMREALSRTRHRLARCGLRPAARGAWAMRGCRRSSRCSRSRTCSRGRSTSIRSRTSNRTTIRSSWQRKAARAARAARAASAVARAARAAAVAARVASAVARAARAAPAGETAATAERGCRRDSRRSCSGTCFRGHRTCTRRGTSDHTSLHSSWMRKGEVARQGATPVALAGTPAARVARAARRVGAAGRRP